MIKPIIYDQWNFAKKKIQETDKIEFFKERQVWWCSVGMNVGNEIYGKGKFFSRPVVIFKKLSNKHFLGIPLTTKVKAGSWYVKFRHKDEDSTALLNQIRVFDKKRLISSMGELDDQDFSRLKSAFKNIYCP